MGKRLKRLQGEATFIDEANCFGVDFVKEAQEYLGALTQIWEQYSKEGWT